MWTLMHLVRPRVIAAGFSAYFACIAVAAWFLSSSLTSPWFDAPITRWIYSVYVVASATFVLGLALVAYRLQTDFDRRLNEVNARLEELRVESTRRPSPPTESIPPGLVVVESQLSGQSLVALDAAVEDEGLSQLPVTLVEDSERVEVSVKSAEEARLLRRGESLRLREAVIMRFLAGPAVAATVILSISGALLPGSDVFLQTHYETNTALILGFAYSWPGIGAYLIISLFGMVGSLRTERKLRRPDWASPR